MPRSKTREKAFPVGMFILMGLIILVAGVLWIRNVLQQPDYTFFVAYKNPSRVTVGVPVYFRGVEVGRVTDVFLDRDQDFAMVEIGITHAGLRIKETTEITVQTEGITGQRYVNMKTEDNGEVAAYIRDGQIIRGKDNVTLEKLQEQLARIAEDRTIEKILVKADKTLSELTVASYEIKQLSTRVNDFVVANQAAASRSIRQFNRTASSVEAAMGEFSGASRETALAIRNFSRQMEGADAAFAAVEQAGQSVSSTVNSVGEQLGQSQIIPRLSQAVSDISAGVQGIQADFSSASAAVKGTAEEAQETLSGTPREVLELNNLIRALGDSGKTLEDNVRALQRRNGNEALQPTFERLESLARGIQETVRNGQVTVQGQDDPQQVRSQLRLLETIGSQLTEASSQLRPALAQQLSTLPKGSEQRQVLQNLSQTVDSLGMIGQGMAEKAGELQPRVENILSSAGKRQQRIGGIAATVLQIRQTAARFDCVARQVSDMLDDRFLGFKLFFGKAGGSYDCEHFDAFDRQ